MRAGGRLLDRHVRPRLDRPGPQARRVHRDRPGRGLRGLRAEADRLGGGGGVAADSDVREAIRGGRAVSEEGSDLRGT